MEGATAWEYFWKITLPYVSPMILANFIYTVIDSFTKTDNKVMELVLQKQSDWNYAYAAAMAWSYFAIVMVVVGIIVMIVNKFIFYEVDYRVCREWIWKNTVPLRSRRLIQPRKS